MGDFNSVSKKHPKYADINSQLLLGISGIHIVYDPNYVKDMTDYFGTKAK